MICSKCKTDKDKFIFVSNQTERITNNVLFVYQLVIIVNHPKNANMIKEEIGVLNAEEVFS